MYVCVCIYICVCLYIYIGFPDDAAGKESASNAGDTGFNPWVRKIPWRRKWQPTSVFLAKKVHGQRKCYSSKGCKELDTTEQLSIHTHIYTHVCAHTHTHTYIYTLFFFKILFWHRPSQSTVKVLVTQSCPTTLGHPMECSPLSSAVHGTLQASELEWVARLQGISSTQGLNLGPLHCRLILHSLSHQGTDIYTLWYFMYRGVYISCPSFIPL